MLSNPKLLLNWISVDESNTKAKISKFKKNVMLTGSSWHSVDGSYGEQMIWEQWNKPVYLKE